MNIKDLVQEQGMGRKLSIFLAAHYSSRLNEQPTAFVILFYHWNTVMLDRRDLGTQIYSSASTEGALQ